MGKFRDIVMVCSTNDVCGMRCVGGQRRKGVNGGMKKWVVLWPKREERLWNVTVAVTLSILCGHFA